MLKIKIQDKHVRDALGRFRTRIPKLAERDAYKVAQLFQKELKAELRRQHLIWTYELYNSLTIRPLEKGWGLYVMDYGYYLDKMRAHYVSPYKYPILHAWAEEHLSHIPIVMYVRPHPWIQPALSRANKQIDKVLSFGEVSRELRR